jgi:L,D-peptidoglycan transpeptidase YkuD (ErfK/YbiS/YcfS/YnhG family)
MKLFCSQWFKSLLVAVLLLLFQSDCPANPPPEPAITLRESRQCLLVVTPSWTSTSGVLTAFERNRDGTIWIQRGRKIPVVVGRNGLGWGQGHGSVQSFRGPVKKEGDQRAAAGIFRLTSAFGYAAAAEARYIKLPYVALTSQFEAIDDPASQYYNQLVERSRIQVPDWRSSEKMRRTDNIYRWGIVVDYNTPPKKGAGSCIFLHVWRRPASATNGCTAMAEHHLKALIAWLDPQDNPVLIQLPFEEFERLRSDWQLP